MKPKAKKSASSSIWRNLGGITVICPPGQPGRYLSRWYGDKARTRAAGKQIPAHYLDAKDLKEVMVTEPIGSKR